MEVKPAKGYTVKRFTLQQINQMIDDLQYMTYRAVAEKHNCSVQVIQHYVPRKPEQIRRKCIAPGCDKIVAIRSQSQLCTSCYRRFYRLTQLEIADRERNGIREVKKGDLS